MEGEIIIVSVISTVGGLLGLYMMQVNWTKRQEIKYKYKKNEIILKNRHRKDMSKLKQAASAESGGSSVLKSLIPLVKNNPDILGELAENFLGGDIPQDKDDIMDTLIDYAKSNPEVVKGIIEGFTSKKDINSDKDTGLY